MFQDVTSLSFQGYRGLDQYHAWLHSQGIVQWPTFFTPDKVRDSVINAEMWLVRNDAGEPIGTMRLSPDADLDFWTADEAGELAMYVSCLAIRRDCAGLGEMMLRWAGDFAAWLGYKLLRLDCRRDNTRLHDYYLNRGWTYLRTETAPGRFSGALFERLAERDTDARNALPAPANRYGALDPGTPVAVDGVGLGVIVGGFPSGGAGEDGPAEDNEIMPGYDVEMHDGRIVSVVRERVQRV